MNYPIDPEDYIEGNELDELRETGLQGRVMDDEPEPTTKPPMTTTTETKNEFEIAADNYLASTQTLPQIEIALRQAFYAGCQYGINITREVYRPELSK